jgi:hypothetical protein
MKKIFLFFVLLGLLSACSNNSSKTIDTKSMNRIIGVWERNGVKVKVEKSGENYFYDGYNTKKDKNRYIDKIWEIAFFLYEPNRGNIIDSTYNNSGSVVYAFQLKNDELIIYNETKLPYKFDKKDILEVWKKVE